MSKTKKKELSEKIIQTIRSYYPKGIDEVEVIGALEMVKLIMFSLSFRKYKAKK